MVAVASPLHTPLQDVQHLLRLCEQQRSVPLLLPVVQHLHKLRVQSNQGSNAGLLEGGRVHFQRGQRKPGRGNGGTDGREEEGVVLNSCRAQTFMRTESFPDFSGLPYSSELSHLVRSSRSGWLQILRRMSMPARA